MILIKKEYPGETLPESAEDIMDALNESDIPQDEYGFHQGTFVITVEWLED